MNETDRELLAQMANTIRGLAMDAIQRANSGHPGLPMGCAEIAACLYGKELIHNPADPGWLGRDRFVLSAGHGSMLLYAALHLTGYDLSLDDIRNFRQLGSRTPGHPEHGETPGVETTTGPLGQGLAMAAGMALANKMAAARLGVEGEGLLDGQVFVLAGDGCMMEGVAHEAACLAGHLALDNLVVIYDSNDVCLDGPTDECFTEDTRARFKAYGWRVAVIDGHDFDQIEKAVRAARRRKGCPSLIIAKTIIGRGSPNLQGTSKTHGAPLGEEEVRLAKESLGIPPEEFHVPEAVREAMRRRLRSLKRKESAWKRRFAAWAAANPQKAALWDAYVEKRLPDDIDARIRGIEIAPNSPGRTASSAVLQKLHDLAPFLVGGSADLSCSDNTMMKASGIVAPGAYDERNVKYGVREFAMAAMTSGMALQGM
ncbi:MAG TPA: 1-deoxy-D-xylulose-5-phosphate synthase N-terminal domain-containing protein, partial [Sumerlaeia bacterium]|nr:1-deoxy-D-xylulose-5-phosphate synthase N-terminal domain-containing protein [Sumerlaeia bacterium]